VGASESERSSGGYQDRYSVLWPGEYPAEPIASDYPSNNRNGMAAFSSRGPTQDGRFGPVIVSPGTNIVSARSQANGAGNGWGVYNDYYAYDGGTSMAAWGLPAMARNMASTPPKNFHGRYRPNSQPMVIMATPMNTLVQPTPSMPL